MLTLVPCRDLPMILNRYYRLPLFVTTKPPSKSPYNNYGWEWEGVGSVIK